MPRPLQTATGFARDLELLNALAMAINRSGEGLRLGEVATAVNREKSQVSRAFARLEEAHLVARDPQTRQFTLGPRLYHLAALTADANLVRAIRPVMKQLVASLGETVHLCALRGAAVVTLHSETPSHSFRAIGWTGVEQPAYLLSAGRVLLAELDEATVRAIYPKAMLPDLPPTSKLRTVNQLLAECAAIRKWGYAVVDEEFENGLSGASAAVWDFRSIAIASLNVAAPSSRIATRLDSLGQRLRQEAQQLSASMGAVARRGSIPIPQVLGG